MTEVYQKDIADAFRKVGAKDGDIIVFHSSLKSMGHVAGGAVTVINGALDAAGKNGTVVVPTLYFDGSPEKTPETFNLKKSPAYNGAVAEAMRQDERSLRSNHFSHSVSAIGAQAEYLTCEHGSGKLLPDPWCETAFSEKSPWSKFYEHDALYAFIGCNMNVCTMKHVVEAKCIIKMLELLPEEKRFEFRKKLHYMCRYTFWSNIDMLPMQERLERDGFIKRTSLGDTYLISIRTKTFVDEVLAILDAEGDKYFRPAYLDWCNDIKEKFL